MKIIRSNPFYILRINVIINGTPLIPRMTYRFTGSLKKVAQEITPQVKKEISSSLETNKAGVHVTCNTDPPLPLHPVTTLVNNNLPAHIAAYNRSIYAAEHISHANKFTNTYKDYPFIYKNPKDNLPITQGRSFVKQIENNNRTVFNDLSDRYNVKVLNYTKMFRANKNYHKHPHQAEPDVILDFSESSSEIAEKGIHGVDFKGGANPAECSNVVYTNISHKLFVEKFEILKRQYEAKYDRLDPELQTVFNDLLAHSNDIEKQNEIFIQNFHKFDPDLLPPLKSMENFYKKPLLPNILNNILVEDIKNSYISKLLDKQKIPVGMKASESKQILSEHEKAINSIINDAGQLPT